MLDDLTKTVKAQLYERANSPLFGAFAISWCAWNYKFLLVLLSSMPAIEKLDYIDSHIFPSFMGVALRGVCFPLLSAIVYIYLYPIPAKYVYQYWRNRQKELKGIQQRIEDETPLTQEEARELRRQSLNAEQAYEKELSQRASEIARLRDIIAELENRPVQAHVEMNEKAEEPAPEPVLTTARVQLDDAQVEILEEIAQANGSIYCDRLVQQSILDKVEAEYAIDEIDRLGLGLRGYDDNGRVLISITPEGRKYLIDWRKRTKTNAAAKVAA